MKRVSRIVEGEQRWIQMEGLADQDSPQTQYKGKDDVSGAFANT